MTCLDRRKGGRGGIAPTYSKLGTRVGWVVSQNDASAGLALGRSLSPYTGGLVGPRPVWTARNISTSPGSNPGTVQPVASSYTDYAIISSCVVIFKTIPLIFFLRRILLFILRLLFNSCIMLIT